MHALCLNEKVPAVLTGRTTGIEEGAIKGLLHDLDGAAQVAHGDGVLAGLIDGDVQLTVTISDADVSADAIVLSVIVNIIVIARSRDSFLMSLPPFCKWGAMPLPISIHRFCSRGGWKSRTGPANFQNSALLLGKSGQKSQKSGRTKRSA